MACIETVNTCITQGNDWFLDLTITEDGVLNDAGEPASPKNLTGATVTLDLKETKDGAVIESPAVSISDPELGRVSFSLTAADTESLITAGAGSLNLFGSPQVTYSDGTVDDLFVLNVEIHESWA